MKRKDYPQLDDAVKIDIDELSVDPRNIRGGAWGRDGDNDLVQSIKRSGILQPIVVRPLDHDSDGCVSEWGIVAGSRRYNAAIEADLDALPCRVREFDETEAMLFSMEENRNRRDSATWRDVEYVGEVIERLTDTGETTASAKQRIMDTIGVSAPTLHRYYKIYQLSPKVRALLREPDDITQEQRDYYRSLSTAMPSRLPLKIGTIVDIQSHLCDWDVREQVSAAFDLDGYQSEDREKLAKRWASSPDASLEELVSENARNGVWTRKIHLDQSTREKIGDAAVDRNKHVDKLMSTIIKQWLRNNNYYDDMERWV